MSPQVQAAIVSGLFTIFGGLITFFVTKAYEQRYLLPIGSERKKSLIGYWKGKVTQPGIGEYEIDMSISITKHKVLAVAKIQHIQDGNSQIIPLTLEGGFLYEKFLKMDYKNDDKANIQFGSITLDVSPNSKRMKGKFSGYGSISESVVGGDIFLEKHVSS